MSDRVRFTGIGVLLLCALTFATPAGSTTNQHIEDFTTKQYCDSLNTTALWDTIAGELRLPPFVPTLVGSYSVTAEGVTIAGDHAFVARGWDGMVVIDISDPTTPSLAGSATTPGSGYSYAVALSGNYAYLAASSDGLVVFDINDPTNPFSVGSYNTPGSAYFVALSGDHAYVAVVISGLQVIDISAPTAPVLAGSYDTPGNARGVYVTGDYAFVADATSGLQVIDITDPAIPTLAGTYNTPGEAWNVVIAGDYAYVTDRTSGLQVIDISDPTAPALAGSYDTPGDARGVYVTGDFVYLGDFGSGLQVFDVSDPTIPSLMYGYDTPGQARDVVVAGEHAFVADRNSGLQVIDICDPVGPGYAGNSHLSSEDVDVVVAGDHAYVANGNAGLRVVDISDPTNPATIGNYVIYDPALGVAVDGDYAYVATDDAGLEVIDISIPSNPTSTGNVSLPGFSYQVALAGDYAYVATFDAGLDVVDVSDPTSPTWVGSYNTPGTALDVEIDGDYAYVADRATGLYVLDISTPTNPTFAGNYVTRHLGAGVAVAGDYAYVADFDSGLAVIDISDPTNPVFAGSYSTPDRGYKVAVAGDYAFVVGRLTTGLLVLDISDPTAPTLTGSYDTPGVSQGVAISGDYAYVCDGSSGMQVIQVFDRSMVLDDNVGQSLVLNSPLGDVSWVRLSASQIGNIQWDASADDGASWKNVSPDAQWHLLDNPGMYLRWRATHIYSFTQPAVNPTVTQLSVEWLISAAVIESIVDIPGDQGRKARVEWMRSAYDFVGATPQIVEYAIYRKHGPESLSGLARAPALEGWDYVTTVPAETEDYYSVVVPTLRDSTIADGMHRTTFLVRARTATPGVHFDSPPDSGYSVDNLAPTPPQQFGVAYNSGGGNDLSWQECPEADFQYFCVYRGQSEDFTPDPGSLEHTTTGTAWHDAVPQGYTYYYKTTAVDYSGNESDPSSAQIVTGIDRHTIPESFALYQNVPNPFNPETTIRYDVPEGRGKVTLRIYDVSGRLVRTLVDGGETPGAKMVNWNGRDNHGRTVASGVYFYQLESSSYTKTRKMLLMK
jgi:hypothetical protein